MSRIDPLIIDQIKTAVNIAEVVGDYVSLKRKGANMWACCPFHGEKSPSFSVSPAKGIYKCFGCGKAGDSVRFVMDIEGIGYPEALKQLAKKYSIEIVEEEYTDEQQAAQNARESLFLVLNHAKNYYQKYLKESADGQAIGLSYFKERGFNMATIDAFELGFSPNAWSAFTEESQKEGYELKNLEASGLTIVKESEEEGKPAKIYDRFRERVIFPIHNVSGKVIAFGARILKADKTQPKYINSPETEVYHKSSILYGLHQAKNSIRAADNVFLCEGYTDVISLHQAGIKNVVASSGTSLTTEQIRLINRFTPNITVLYDGDAAGIKASLRGMDMILEEGLNVKLASFPEGEDPDSFVRKIGSEAFEAYIKEKATDFIEFKTDLAIAEVGNDPVKKAELIKDIVESIAKIPDNIKKMVFIQRTAQKMGIAEDLLIAEGNKITLRDRKNKEKSLQQGKNQSNGFVPLPEGVDPFHPDFEANEIAEKQENLTQENLYYQEKECIRLLINYGHIAMEDEKNKELTIGQYVIDELGGIDFTYEPYAQMLQKMRAEHDFKTNTLEFFNKTSQEIFIQEAIELSFEKYQISENWESKHQIVVTTEQESIDTLAYDNLIRIKKCHTQNKLKVLKEKLKTQMSEEDEILTTQAYMETKKEEAHYAKILGNVILR